MGGNGHYLETAYNGRHPLKHRPFMSSTATVWKGEYASHWSSPRLRPSHYHHSTPSTNQRSASDNRVTLFLFQPITDAKSVTLNGPWTRTQVEQHSARQRWVRENNRKCLLNYKNKGFKVYFKMEFKGFNTVYYYCIRNLQLQVYITVLAAFKRLFSLICIRFAVLFDFCLLFLFIYKS